MWRRCWCCPWLSPSGCALRALVACLEKDCGRDAGRAMKCHVRGFGHNAQQNMGHLRAFPDWSVVLSYPLTVEMG